MTPPGPPPADLAALGLPAAALLLLDKLRFFYCRARPWCWPSDAELVRRTGLSVHQVRRALRRLEADGLIRRRTDALRLPGGAARRRRVIDLLVAPPGAGAQPDCAPARIGECAPARKEKVVVEGGWNPGEGPGADERRRPRRYREPAAAPVAPSREAGSTDQAGRVACLGPPPPTSPASSPPASPPAPTPTPAPSADPPVAPPSADLPPLSAAPKAEPTSPPCPAPAPRPVPPSPPAAAARRRPTLTIEALETLAVDDPILAGELARRKAAAARAAAAAAVAPPATTPELLARIRESPAYVAQATQALAVELGDERSWRGLHALCRRAFEGELAPEALVHAHAKATNPQARRPGAIFTIESRRWRPAPG